MSENREGGLSWNKCNTLTYKTKTKEIINQEDRKGKENAEEKKIISGKVLKGNKVGKK